MIYYIYDLDYVIEFNLSTEFQENISCFFFFSFFFKYLLFYRKTFDFVKNTYKRIQIVAFNMNAFNYDIVYLL